MVLPRSMRPLEAGYGDNGFSFSFDAWYNYGDGISQIGTYTPASRVTDGNYSDAPWFSFSLAPTAAPGKGVEAGRLRSIRACSGQAARPRPDAARL